MCPRSEELPSRRAQKDFWRELNSADGHVCTGLSMQYEERRKVCGANESLGVLWKRK